MAETCGGCRFFFPATQTCQANPPQVISGFGLSYSTAAKNESIWPVVKPSDWCGLWKAIQLTTTEVPNAEETG